MRRFIWILLMLPSAAQGQTVPLDLAKALLVGMNPLHDSPWVEIVVGGPPSRFKTEDLQGMRLMGSAGYAGSAVLIYAVDGDLATARDTALAQLRSAGWQPAPPQRRSPFYESGFIPSDASIEMDQRHVLCRPDRALFVFPVEIPSGPRVLRLMYMGDEMSSMCNRPEMPARPRDPWSEAPIPRLEPPLGSTIRTGGRSSSGDAYSITAFATTAMTSAKLIEHYSEQMKSAGWTAAEASTNAAAGFRTFRKKLESNDWTATLTSTVATDQLKILELSLYNVSALSRRGW